MGPTVASVNPMKANCKILTVQLLRQDRVQFQCEVFANALVCGHLQIQLPRALAESWVDKLQPDESFDIQLPFTIDVQPQCPHCAAGDAFVAPGVHQVGSGPMTVQCTSIGMGALAPVGIASLGYPVNVVETLDGKLAQEPLVPLASISCHQGCRCANWPDCEHCGPPRL